MASLSEITGASAVTIRRDLTELEALGLLRRTHGGAVRTLQRGNPQPFSARHREELDDKTRLADAVAQLIAEDESVIVDKANYQKELVDTGYYTQAQLGG